MSGSRSAWQQLDGESDKAFAAFNLYRTMPVQTRSIFAVAEEWGAKVSPRRRLRRDAPSQFRAWAVRYSACARAFESAMLSTMRVSSCIGK